MSKVVSKCLKFWEYPQLVSSPGILKLLGLSIASHPDT